MAPDRNDTEFLVAFLTKSGARQVLDGKEGDAFPIVDWFDRDPSSGLTGRVVSVADFRREPTGFLPFQPWSLGPEDYNVARIRYVFPGWSIRHGWTDAPELTPEEIDRATGGLGTPDCGDL